MRGHLGGICAVACVVLGAARASGQQMTSVRDSTTRMSSQWRFGVWIAEGTKQPIKTRLGHKHDRSLYITALRAERPIYRYKHVTIDYTADLHPLIVATANREYTEIPLCNPGSPCSYAPDSYDLVPSRHTAYGFGITPIGVRVRTKIYGPVQFAIAASGGGGYFNRRIPDPAETRFNFLADGNLSLLVRTPIGGISAGFRWHHISNANTGRVNPAIDSRLLFVGYEM